MNDKRICKSNNRNKNIINLIKMNRKLGESNSIFFKNYAHNKNKKICEKYYPVL